MNEGLRPPELRDLDKQDDPNREYPVINQLINELPPTAKLIIPILRKTEPRLAAEELSSASPMNNPDTVLSLKVGPSQDSLIEQGYELCPITRMMWKKKEEQ